MKIGNIELPDKALFLAPMEDVTDVSFRYMCKMYGADMMYTEFIASEALIRNIPKSFQKLTIHEYERPMGIQLYGHNIEAMVESAKIAEQYSPDVIDINFGCPVKKIATRGAGSGMLRDIPKLLKMTEEIVKAVNIPVTVKTRLGWDEDSKVIVELAEKLQDVGIQALTIHGRTRAQLYKGLADWTLIGEVKNNPRMKIPIIGNGDVIDGATAKKRFDETGVDAIMIGRATYGRPWIFKEIRHFLETGEQLAPMPIPERVEMAKIHLQRSLQHKGDRRGVYEMRRHLATYFKALPHFKETRAKLVTTNDAEELMRIIDEINLTWGDFVLTQPDELEIKSCDM